MVLAKIAPLAVVHREVAAEVRSIDLGKVVEGADLRHTFAIRNTTAQPFKVVAIKKSCGCETAHVTEGAVVAPGELLEVPYSLSKHGFGDRKGQLVITTDADDDSLRVIELHLRGYIQPKIWTTPAELELSDREESTSTQLLRIESIIPGLLDSFQDATTNRGNVSVTIEERAADAIVFRVAIAPESPFGTTYDLIYFSFDNRVHPSLNVRVRARKGHPLAIIPATLKLPAFGSSETQTRKVRLMSPAGAAGGFRITTVESPEGIAIDDLPTEPRQTCDVSLTFHQPQSALKEQTVVFHTDPPGAVTLTIRYSAQAKP